jgi:hypothetical protein
MAQLACEIDKLSSNNGSLGLLCDANLDTEFIANESESESERVCACEEVCVCVCAWSIDGTTRYGIANNTNTSYDRGSLWFSTPSTSANRATSTSGRSLLAIAARARSLETVKQPMSYWQWNPITPNASNQSANRSNNETAGVEEGYKHQGARVREYESERLLVDVMGFGCDEGAQER